MKTVKSVLLILVVILFPAKKKSNPVSSDVDFTYFTTSWTNSFEEETINHEIEIFRPSNYKEFPKSRYREGLIFAQDSNCSYLVLAPNDGHYFQNGKWSFVNREKKYCTNSRYIWCGVQKIPNRRIETRFVKINYRQLSIIVLAT